MVRLLGVAIVLVALGRAAAEDFFGEQKQPYQPVPEQTDFQATWGMQKQLSQTSPVTQTGKESDLAAAHPGSGWATSGSAASKDVLSLGTGRDNAPGDPKVSQRERPDRFEGVSREQGWTLQAMLERWFKPASDEDGEGGRRLDWSWPKSRPLSSGRDRGSDVLLNTRSQALSPKKQTPPVSPVENVSGMSLARAAQKDRESRIYVTVALDEKLRDAVGEFSNASRFELDAGARPAQGARGQIIARGWIAREDISSAVRFHGLKRIEFDSAGQPNAPAPATGKDYSEFASLALRVRPGEDPLLVYHDAVERLAPAGLGSTTMLGVEEGVRGETVLMMSATIRPRAFSSVLADPAVLRVMPLALRQPPEPALRRSIFDLPAHLWRRHPLFLAIVIFSHLALIFIGLRGARRTHD